MHASDFSLGFDEEQNIGVSRAEELPTAAVHLVCALYITIACSLCCAIKTFFWSDNKGSTVEITIQAIYID